MAGTQIGTAWIQIKPSTTGLRSAVQKELNTELTPVADKSGEDAGKSWGESFAKKVKATVALAAIGKFISDSIMVGMDFEAQMSQVAATLGYSVDELNDKSSDASVSLNKLSDFARQMGETTVFTAREAAESLNRLALAGMDAEQSMELLPTVLNLAAAGNLELEAASNHVVTAQKALGLTTEETNTLIDQMARTASRSNTSVATLGEGIQTVGALGRGLAGGTKELTTVLGALADVGYDGAEGGTKLRNVLVRLESPTKAAQEQLEKLGVSVYDSTGNLRNTIDIFQDLGRAMQGFTQEQRDAVLSDLFNMRDMAAASALIGTTTERWQELGAAIEDSKGAAEQMAGVQLDNMKGDVTLLKSAFESFQVTLSQTLEPLLRPFIQAITGFFQFLAENEWAMDIFLGLITAIAGALISTLVPAIWATTTALLASPITWITLGVGLLIAGIIALLTHLDEVKAFFEKIGNQIIAFIQPVIDWFKGAWEFLKQFWAALVDAYGKILDKIISIPERIKELFGKIKQFFSDFWNNMVEKVKQIATFIGETVSGIFKAAVNGVLAFIENFINAPIRLLNKFIGLINKAFGFVGVNIGLIGEVKLPRLAQGGIVEGIGTETSDSNIVALSKGEYVIRAAAAKEIGYRNLEEMNETGSLPRGGVTNYFTINGYNKSPEELATIISRKIGLRTQGVMA